MNGITSSQIYFNFIRNNYSICFYGKSLDKKIVSVAQRIFSALKLLLTPIIFIIGSVIWLKEKTCSKIKQLIYKADKVQQKAKPSLLAIGHGHLPVDPQLHILRYLTKIEIESLASVSKATRAVANNDRLWTSIAKKEKIDLEGERKGIKKLVVQKYHQKEFIEFFKRFFFHEYGEYLKRAENWKPSTVIPAGSSFSVFLWKCFHVCDAEFSLSEKIDKIKTIVEEIKNSYQFDFYIAMVGGSRLDLSDEAEVSTRFLSNFNEPIRNPKFVIEKRHLPPLEVLQSWFNFKIHMLFVRTDTPELPPFPHSPFEKIERQTFFNDKKFNENIWVNAKTKGFQYITYINPTLTQTQIRT